MLAFQRHLPREQLLPGRRATELLARNPLVRHTGVGQQPDMRRCQQQAVDRGAEGGEGAGEAGLTVGRYQRGKPVRDHYYHGHK